MYLSKIQHVFVIMFIVWQNDWRRCPSSDWFLRFWLLPSYRRCLLSLPTWLIHFSSFNHISSIHDTQRTSESQSVWFFFSFLLQCFFPPGWLGEWVGRCGVQHGQWMIGGSPLIIHPRQMDNTKIAQNWRRNIFAFSFLVDASEEEKHDLLNCSCSMWRYLLASQSEPGGDQPRILIESSTKFYHSMHCHSMLYGRYSTSK